MRRKQWIALLFTVVLLLSISPASLAATKLMEKGKVKGNFYSNPDDMTFTIPDGFEFAAQRTKNLDFLRIILTGKLEHGFGPAVVIDVSTGYQDVEDYKEHGFVRDVQKYTIDRSDEYKDGYLINEEIREEYGVKVLESLMVFRLERRGVPRVAFAYGYSWSTDRYFVRAYYICFGAQRTLTEDVSRFNELYNSIVVP